MPRSRNKYSRAAIRSKTRRPKNQRSSKWFYVTISLIAVLGVVLVWVARGGDASSSNDISVPPRVATVDHPVDHWHTAFAVNVCGEWLTNPPEFEQAAGNSNVIAGIHTHADGFIHTHPRVLSEAGNNATLGKFLKYGGWAASEDSLKLWTGPSSEPTKTEWSNGDKCPNAAGKAGEGKPGRVVFQVNCKTVEGNPSDYRLQDQHVVAIGFLPQGKKLEAPPNAASAPANDGSDAVAINQKGCTPTSANNPGVADTAPATTATTTK